VNVLTTCKDVVGALLLVFLLPLWMVLGLGVVAAVVIRQLYWWVRGNTTVVSRLAARLRSPSRHGASAPSLPSPTGPSTQAVFTTRQTAHPRPTTLQG
jgi:hypothetical protein